MNEEWRSAPGWADLYEVSDHGRVRSLPRVRLDGASLDGKVLKLNRVAKGRNYLAVHLYRDGKRSAVRVHKLVALAFIGPYPDGMEILHVNGDSSDNRAANLRYGTHQENVADTFAHGTAAVFGRTHCPNGHEYTPENTYVKPSEAPTRRCRRCRALESARYHAQKRARQANGGGR